MQKCEATLDVSGVARAEGVWKGQREVGMLMWDHLRPRLVGLSWRFKRGPKYCRPSRDSPRVDAPAIPGGGKAGSRLP